MMCLRATCGQIVGVFVSSTTRLGTRPAGSNPGARCYVQTYAPISWTGVRRSAAPLILCSLAPRQSFSVCSWLLPGRPMEQPPAPPVNTDQVAPVSPADRAFVEDLEHRSFEYFWEQADHGTGLVLDRARVDGGRAKGPSRDIASTAATGFGLTAICIGAEHGWISKKEAADRVRARSSSSPTRRTRSTAGSTTGWTSPPATASGTARHPPWIPRFCWRASSRPGNISPTIPRFRSSPAKSTTAWTSNGCWMAIRCCSRTAGVPGKALSRTSGTLIANWACCTFWPSARPPIPFRPNPGMPGSAPFTNTESTSSSAAARCSRTSIRRPGSISATAATAASWISS